MNVMKKIIKKQKNKKLKTDISKKQYVKDNLLESLGAKASF